MARLFSKRVRESPGCKPLVEMLELAREARWSRWEQAQAAFLESMWRFDRNLAEGIADQGDNQNGKGDFFTDLICLLLEGCSDKVLCSRPPVPGLIFRRHALDAAYPPKGTLEVLLETKMLGAPKNPRNKKQRNPLGRPGSADLDKRIKEAGLKTIDLKAEWARVAGVGEGPTSDFLTWLRRSKPSCYLLLGVRVIDGGDLQRVIRLADSACQVMDRCGIFCFEPRKDRYELVQEVPTHLELDRVCSRICDQLRNLA